MKCIPSISLFFALTALTSIAGEEDIVEYLDVASFQSGHEDSWVPTSIGVNLSRYFETGWPSEFSQILPGFGIRGKFLDEMKIELLAKASFMGWVGASMGPTLGNSGTGAGGSAWIGPEFFGGEATLYWDRDGFNPELGFYLALPIGEKRNGKYGFLLDDFPWF